MMNKTPERPNVYFWTFGFLLNNSMQCTFKIASMLARLSCICIYHPLQLSSCNDAICLIAEQQLKNDSSAAPGHCIVYCIRPIKLVYDITGT